MITEDYVSLEVAKLLKEKGFDEPCDFVYDGDKLEWIQHIDTSELTLKHLILYGSNIIS